MSVTVNSSQWTAIAQADRSEAANFDANSDTYKALIAAANAADTAAKSPTNTALAAAAAQAELTAINALQNDSKASATLESYEINLSTVLNIPEPENTDTNQTVLMTKLSTVASSTYADGTAEADLATIMMLLLQFAQITKTVARTERKAALDSALAALNDAAEKIHAAALDRYNGAIGKAVFEIAGAATTIATSVALVAHTQADAEPAAPNRGIETDEEFQVRRTAYENEPGYKTAVGDGTVAQYEIDNPRPQQLQSIPGVRPDKTDAEYNTELTAYESDPDYQRLPNDPVAQAEYERVHPRPVPETPEQFELRVDAYESTPGYRNADTLWNRTNGVKTRYERLYPRPQAETPIEFQARVDAYEATPSYRSITKQAGDDLTAYETAHPRPVQVESDAHWAARQNAHAEEFQKYTQATNMKQTMLMTYSQLTGAIGQLVSAPGGVFEASYNLKAADEETQQKKLEAEAQMQNAKADDAQSAKQSMGESINTIIGALRDIKKDLNDLAMSIARAI